MKEKDPTRVKAGRKSRRKGRKNEQELAMYIAGYFGYSVNPLDKLLPNYYLNHCKRTARDRQKGMGDLWTSKELRKGFNFPWLIEAKDEEGWRLESLFEGKNTWLLDYWKQCKEEAAETEQPPLLIFTKNRCPWYVMFCVYHIPPELNVSFATQPTWTEIPRLNLMLGKECLTIVKLEDFMRLLYGSNAVTNEHAQPLECLPRTVREEGQSELCEGDRKGEEPQG